MDEFAARRLGIPARGRRFFCTNPVHEAAYLQRTLDEMVDLYRPGQPDVTYPVQASADGAPALRAVWRAAKHARLDAAAQVRRIVRGHFRENAIRRILRWAQKRLRKASLKQKLGILRFQQRQLANDNL